MLLAFFIQNNNIIIIREKPNYLFSLFYLLFLNGIFLVFLKSGR